MRDWRLVMASMRTKSPTVDEINEALQFQDFKHRAQLKSRLVLLNRVQLCNLFGPTFAERARLFLEPPVDAAPPKLKLKRVSNSKLRSKTTRRAATLGDDAQRAL
jgi:hypothetical protein